MSCAHPTSSFPSGCGPEHRSPIHPDVQGTRPTQSTQSIVTGPEWYYYPVSRREGRAYRRSPERPTNGPLRSCQIPSGSTERPRNLAMRAVSRARRRYRRCYTGKISSRANGHKIIHTLPAFVSSINVCARPFDVKPRESRSDVSLAALKEIRNRTH